MTDAGRGLRVQALVLALATVTGCGRDAGRGGHGVSVTDSAGVEIVRNDSVGRLGRLHARETLRLGTVEDEGPELFDQVYALALDSAGRIYVGNTGTGTVRVFAPDGAFRGELGRRGDGPSEVRAVNALFVTGDTVVVTDLDGGGKQVLFRRDGTFLTSWGLWRPDGSGVVPLARTAAGWLASYDPPYRSFVLAEGERRDVMRNFHLVDDPAERSDGRPVLSVSTGTLYGTLVLGQPLNLPGPFVPLWSEGFDAAGRIYLSRGEDYRIDVYAPDGALVRSVRRAFTPRVLTDEDLTELGARLLQALDSVGGNEAPTALRALQRDMQERRMRLPHPSIASPIGRILVSGDGSFWVAHRTAPPVEAELRAAHTARGDVPPEPTEWGLFDAEGVYLGDVELPARFRPEAVRGREVVGVWKDPLDVEYVVRLEAQRPLRP